MYISKKEKYYITYETELWNYVVESSLWGDREKIGNTCNRRKISSDLK